MNPKKKLPEKGNETRIAVQIKKSLSAYSLALVLILLLGAFLSLYFFYGPSWINGSDNYVYASNAHQLAATGNVYPVWGEDSAKLLLIFGIAIFVKILGYSLLSLSLFGVSCFLGTIAVIYLIGKNLYNQRAGLIGAFLYSICPLVVTYSSNLGDGVPMVFFISLAALFAILALKKKKLSKSYYMLAGFTPAISYLIVPEGAIGAASVLFILGISIFYNPVGKKNVRKAEIGFMLGAAGAIIALVVVLLLGFIESGHWLLIISVINNGLTSWQTSPGVFAYLRWLFLPSYQNVFGYFGFAFAVSSVYLLILKDKRLVIPFLWFMFTFLYLGFGSQSITTYVPVLARVRFAILLCPAIVLIIAFGFARIIGYVEKKTLAIRIGIYAIVSCTFLLFFISSFFTIRYIDYSQLNMVTPLIQTGQYVNSLGPNVTVFGPSNLPWISYTNYKANLITLGYIGLEGNCNVTKTFMLKSGEYMIGELNGSYSSCGFVMVFRPHPIEWLESYRYTGLNYTYLNLSNTAVYFYK